MDVDTTQLVHTLLLRQTPYSARELAETPVSFILPVVRFGGKG
jgi:hypothetical protein